MPSAFSEPVRRCALQRGAPIDWRWVLSVKQRRGYHRACVATAAWNARSVRLPMIPMSAKTQVTEANQMIVRITSMGREFARPWAYPPVPKVIESGVPPAR
jgi:hypothetical protein